MIHYFKSKLYFTGARRAIDISHLLKGTTPKLESLLSRCTVLFHVIFEMMRHARNDKLKARKVNQLHSNRRTMF